MNRQPTFPGRARSAAPAAQDRAGFRLGLLLVLLLTWSLNAVSATAREDEGERPPEDAAASGPPSGPALPEGLDAQAPEEPALPTGLGDSQQPEGPALPAGLGDQDATDAQDGQPRDRTAANAFVDTLTGFWDLRAGARVRDDPNQRTTALAESRLQLSRDTYLGDALLRLTADLVYDDVAADRSIGLESGSGWLDLREAYFGTPLGEAVDLRLGRQVLTWGVGDLLFLNDLFPKDWNAFLSGRDIEYLKAPSDALRLSFYLPAFNLDVVYTPKFDADRFVDNRRLSFFDPRFGTVVGNDVSFMPNRPDDWFADDEVAIRLYRIVAGWEVAAYGYRGFWKSPQGFDPVTGRPVFPELSSWGGSARGTLGPGILSLETAWYRSRDDRSGTNPFLPNSQLRFLAGYEQELLPDFTLGAQYYLERTLDHDELVANQPPGIRPPDEHRHVLTLRATLLTHSQNVTWSLFTFASPSDEDAYLRGSWEWKATDTWSVSAGFNLFEGQSEQTFFGQFETNSNIYAALRRGF
jgi:hypothetical protein